MRRFTAILLAVATLGLLGASAPLTLTTPSVVVYPFVSGGGLSQEAGPSISVAIAGRMTSLGGIIVKPAPPGIVSTQYLSTARQLGVDYYVSGFATAVGYQISLVEQVVSVYSGSVVWSWTANLQSEVDATAQGDLIRTAIQSHAGRAYAALDTKAPTGPSENRGEGSNEANIRLSGPRQAAQAPPSGGSQNAAPPKKRDEVALAPQPAPTGPRVGVVTFAGNNAFNAYAAASIIRKLRSLGYNATFADARTQDLALLGTVICTKSDAKMLFGGTLSTQRDDPTETAWTTAQVQLTGYSCGTQSTATKSVAGQAYAFRPQTAIDDAVNSALKAYLHIK